MTTRGWHSFQIVYALGAAAALLDLFTTWLGQETNPRYEQNPVGSLILSGAGPLGDVAVLAVLGGVVYLSCWWLAHQQAHRALTLANAVLAIAVLMRAVVVVAAALSLAGAVR